MRVYQIGGSWFVGSSVDDAKLQWEAYWSTDWDPEDPEPQVCDDDEEFTIEERGPSGEDLTKTFAEWAQINGPGWLAMEI